MHALRQGTGRPLVLVHGLGSSGRTFDPVIPGLARHREVIAPDLPGFGQTPPLAGEVTIASLADALERWLSEEGLTDADLVGSSMGARLVLELARRGVGRGVVALDPGGFWSPGQVTYFKATLRPSIRLVRLLRPLLPALTSTAVGRTALLIQFSAAPWRLPKELALHELQTIADGPSTDEAFDALADGPLQEGMRPGTARGPMVIGWGRKDRVTLPGQSRRARRLFPEATLHWFDDCGHFPHWDQPDQTTAVILSAVGSGS